MREKYESLSLAVLKDLAKARGLKGVSAFKKADLIEAMLQADEADKNKTETTSDKAVEKNEKKQEERTGSIRREESEFDTGERANGILEVLPDGYGFIRCENYMPGDNDVYVSPSLIRRFNLKTGDIISGNTRLKSQGEKFSALLFVSDVNGYPPYEASKRQSFEELTPIFPNQRIKLETARSSTAMRIMDLVAPVGKGQRGMIVSLSLIHI